MPNRSECFDNEFSALVWRLKYRHSHASTGLAETSIRDSWDRVARAAASVETTARVEWTRRFREMLEGFRFLPAGRILASAGTNLDATLFSCFVMGPIEDSITGIFDSLKDCAVTMQRGGGIGCDFSTLRPAGSRAHTTGRTASGPVSYMHLWNQMCTTLLSTAQRRGAMMGVLRCDHPDIVEFIDAKRDSSALTNFNLSVLVTDAFMDAVAADRTWDLVFPDTGGQAESDTKLRVLQWPGYANPVACGIRSTVSAKALWQRVVDDAYETAEPGVLFVDRINERNTLHYREYITTTNPCAEVPLPPYGACNLGSINLAVHVDAPFTKRATLDFEAIGSLARDATRFLDNVIDLSRFPLPAQAAEARATRRIGLGITGLADALIMLGHRYDSEGARVLAHTVLSRVRDEAYSASIELAREKGRFPAFEKDAWLDGPHARTLPDEIRDGIAQHGLRNSHLIAIAPAGSISILANNVSSGIEPVFAASMQRSLQREALEKTSHEVSDYAYSLWTRSNPRAAGLPPDFVTAHEIAPDDHLLMAAALQPVVDHSISKTINVPSAIPRDEVRAIYRRAFDLGLKGCTVFRSDTIRGSVVSGAPPPDGIHCCQPDAEQD